VLARELNWAWTESALGRLLLGCTAAGLAYIGLDAQREPDGLARRARSRALELAPEPCAAAGILAAAERQLGEYALGRRRSFDLPLDPGGTDFQRAVWRELSAIDYGSTRTYGELAERLGQPNAARAVGLAAGRNPLPIVVPCHRLLSAAGLGGFSAGLERKRALLALEGITLGDAPGPRQGTLPWA
jgi:methylated-DNA-[protein]-cysteine S-methyltransferase